MSEERVSIVNNPLNVILRSLASTPYTNEKFLASRVIPIKKTDTSNPYLDIYDTIFKRLREYVTRGKPYVVRDNDTLAFISYREYGTTSLWFILQILNDISHSYELQTGQIITIYELRQIEEFLKEVSLLVDENTRKKVIKI